MTHDVRSTSVDPLCCCEYFDRNNERNHIIGCCCNCIDFDQAIDNLICCRRTSLSTRRGMFLTFQDHLRIPWCGGAKRLSLDEIVPVVVLPVAFSLAAINMYCAILVAMMLPMFLGYMFFHQKRRSKFFFSWACSSVAYLWLLFEATIPLMELLPEENLVMILFITLSLVCFYRTRRRAALNHVVQSTNDADNLPDITEERETSLLIGNGGGSDDEVDNDEHPQHCTKCHKYMPPRTFHCGHCQVCVVKRDHHSVWLDCCIGQRNHRLFVAGLLFGFIALMVGTNLSLTTICHPFLVANIYGVHIFMPDDCGEVFDQFDLGLSFVGSIYAICMALCTLMALIQQIFFISKGVTMTEWRRHGEQQHTRRNCLWNWKSFLFCYR